MNDEKQPGCNETSKGQATQDATDERRQEMAIPGKLDNGFGPRAARQRRRDCTQQDGHGQYPHEQHNDGAKIEAG